MHAVSLNVYGLLSRPYKTTMKAHILTGVLLFLSLSYFNKLNKIYSDEGLKLETSVFETFIRWLIYLIDLVVDKLTQFSHF